jgi:hypothetical protein
VRRKPYIYGERVEGTLAGGPAAWWRWHVRCEKCTWEIEYTTPAVSHPFLIEVAERHANTYRHRVRR